MEKNNILSATLLDLIFDGRNQQYGAYQLRKTYNRRIVAALMITGALCVVVFMGTALANNLNEDKPARPRMGSEVIIIPEEKSKKIIVPPPVPPLATQQPPPAAISKKLSTIVLAETVLDPPPAIKELDGFKINVANNTTGESEIGLAIQQLGNGAGIIEPPRKKADPEGIVEFVQVEAAFEGGPQAWATFLKRNLNADVAPENGAPAAIYTVYIQFVVDKEGNVSDLKALTNHGYGMEEEAIRVLKKAKKWIPAIQNGNAVKAYRKQPITFDVQDGN